MTKKGQFILIKEKKMLIFARHYVDNKEIKAKKNK